jgi:hypothetical protein
MLIIYITDISTWDGDAWVIDKKEQVVGIHVAGENQRFV